MKHINLFWFSKSRMQNINISNFGDDINPLLIQKITNKEIIWKNPAEQSWYEKNFTKINFAIGSILHFATDNCNIWGSGLIDSQSNFPQKAKYYAVRGPETYKILKNNGCKVQEVFGDPALLLPKYFQPSTRKKYSLGIIPHYVEIDDFNNKYPNLSAEIKIIDLRNDVLQVIEEITSCKKIMSSSLHGIIVPMAYDIPTIRITLSDKIYGNGIKYEDYYQSVGIAEHSILNPNFETLTPSEIVNLFHRNNHCTSIKNDLIQLQDELLNNNPF